MHRRLSFVMIVMALAAAGVTWAAQDGTAISEAACAPALENLWAAASEACIGGPAGFVCNGGSPPQVQPDGPVANSLAVPGALVEVGVVDTIHTPPLVVETGTAGLAWLRPDAPIRFTGVLVGDVSLRDVAPPEFPAWQSIIVQTGENAPSCAGVPPNAFVVQTPLGAPTNIAINGVSLGLNGTVVVQAAADQTVFAALSGETLVFAAGQNQLLRTGQQVSVPYSGGSYASPVGGPTLPQLLDPALVRYLPVALLDRPVIVPQAGYVSTQGEVNMRAAPSTDAAILQQVPAGQNMAVLGRDTTGEWLHVRLDSGETGWMFASLLAQNLGSIDAVYDATPLPPQRYGDMGRTAKIVAPAGVNLRQYPDVTFPLVLTIPDGEQVTLLARSPYNPWVKVDYNGVVGWLSLVTLDTEAIIEALPVDLNVPPPPPPTRVPGSFGNAFPDPNAGN